MLDKLCKKLQDIGLGMLEDEDLGRRALGAFYVSLSEKERDGQQEEFLFSLFNCLIEASDRLNDSVVPLFNMFIDSGSGVEAFKSVILLFDENIDLAACKDLIFSAVLNDVTYDDFDEILKISSDQDEFERILNEKVKGIVAADSEFDENKEAASAELVPMEIGKDFINYLKAENERLTKQADELKGKLMVSLEKEKDATEKSFVLKAEISEQKTEIGRLQRDLSKAKLSVGLIETKYKKSQEMFERERKINEKLSSDMISDRPDPGLIESLRSENKALKETISSIDNENARLTSLNENIQSENTKLLQDISLLNEEIASLKDEVEGLRNRNIPAQAMPVFSLDDVSSRDDMSFPFLNNGIDEEPQTTLNTPFFTSGFTSDLFNDDEPEDYSESDIITVENNKSSVLKSSNIFSTLLSKHFEKKFVKKPQAEQNNLIFMKLMEGNYSKEVLKTVRKAIESNNSVSRIDLYKVISAKGDMNEILRLCNAA